MKVSKLPYSALEGTRDQHCLLQHTSFALVMCLSHTYTTIILARLYTRYNLSHSRLKSCYNNGDLSFKPNDQSFSTTTIATSGTKDLSELLKIWGTLNWFKEENWKLMRNNLSLRTVVEGYKTETFFFFPSSKRCLHLCQGGISAHQKELRPWDFFWDAKLGGLH